jgi:3-isopropylmalate dehydratase small subunit
MILEGRAWVFGDQVDTDLLAPGPYMKKPLAELAAHCLEAIAPEFARDVRPGDLVVGGIGFGIGSSREQAVQALLHLGVAGIVAKSYARIFYRNALNLGLPALACPGIDVRDGERIRIEPLTGRIVNLDRGLAFDCEPIPPALFDVVAAGGLMPWLERRLQGQRA